MPKRIKISLYRATDTKTSLIILRIILFGFIITTLVKMPHSLANYPISITPDSAPTMTFHPHDQPIDPFVFNAFVRDNMPTDPTEAEFYIRESDMIDYKHPLVQEIAKDISELASTDYDKAKAVCDYLHANFAYTIENREFVASKILERNYGACLEYCISAIALLNAMDIPAALVYTTGYISDYTDCSRQEYLESLQSEIIAYYESGKVFKFTPRHTVILAFVEERWIEIDPTAGWFDTANRQSAAAQVYFMVYAPSIPTPTQYSPSGTPVTLFQSNSRVSVDGTLVDRFPAFVSGGKTYFPINALGKAIADYGETDLKQFNVFFFTHRIGVFVPPPTKNCAMVVVDQATSYAGATSGYTGDYHTAEFAYLDIDTAIGINGIYREIDVIQGYRNNTDVGDSTKVCEYFVEINGLLSALNISVTYDSVTDTYLLDTIRSFD